ncbi:MAG: KamA family radical SAM protein [Candidatus Latescibacterota bacterium]|nr:MAG: KamA family radical SAM protein [Candidatus Latescibacterota bacterium]
MSRPKYVTKIDQVTQLNEDEKKRIRKVTEEFAFRANDYYLSLIDWNDPKDPIRRLVVPVEAELEVWGELDASREAEYTKVPGLEHKYNATGLLLVNDVCGAYCRFCFRKRIFMVENDEVVKDVIAGLEYIRDHDEITNVLLTGGDPLVMSTGKLERIVSRLRDIDHVQIIRIGTKLPAFNPYRIIDDPSLLEMIRKYSTTYKRMYFVVHFNHPRELTDVAVEGLALLRDAGAILVNQTPLIAGVIDDAFVLSELFNRLSYIGVPPYYVFQCRPTLGNKTYSIPLERAYEIFEQGRMNSSGLARRARFVMSHATGKVEVVGLTGEHIHFKYLRAHYDEDNSRFLVFKRDPSAYWFDDYQEAVDANGVENPFLAARTELDSGDTP